MKKRFLSLLLAFGMIFCLSSCRENAEEEIEESQTPSVELPKEEEAEELTPPEPEGPSGINPLTGLPMEVELESKRPIAVMFNNLKKAQPQLGVSQADLIYEVPAEGGITRMLGLFQSLDGVGNLGSIRSTRTYYLELALGHDALLVHAGGSPDAYQKIPAWGVDNMDGVRGGTDAKIFWRDPERKKTAGFEHSLLTTGDKIQAYLSGGRYRTEHELDYQYEQAFAEDATPIHGLPASHISLKFSHYKTGLFDYDPESNSYLVSQYEKPYVDGNSGEQCGFTNVLVLETAISNISGDDQGRLDVKLTGEGKGTFFCGGKGEPILWSKKDRNSPFIYTTEDGKPLAFGKGKSYICIVSPRSSTLKFE